MKQLTIEEKAKLYDEFQKEYNSQFALELTKKELIGLMTLKGTYEHFVYSSHIPSVINDISKHVETLYYSKDYIEERDHSKLLNVSDSLGLINLLTGLADAAQDLTPIKYAH